MMKVPVEEIAAALAVSVRHTEFDMTGILGPDLARAALGQLMFDPIDQVSVDTVGRVYAELDARGDTPPLVLVLLTSLRTVCRRECLQEGEA